MRRRPPRRWPSWPWQVIGGGIAALIALALVAGGAGGAAAAVETKLVLAQDSQLVAAHQSWLLPLRDQPLLTFLKGPVVKVAGFGAATGRALSPFVPCACLVSGSLYRCGESLVEMPLER